MTIKIWLLKDTSASEKTKIERVYYKQRSSTNGKMLGFSLYFQGLPRPKNNTITSQS